MQEDKRSSILLAVSLSILAVVGFNWLYPTPQTPPSTGNHRLVLPNAPTPGRVAPSRRKALQNSEHGRVKIRSGSVSGSLSLSGAFLDDWTLLHYKKTPKGQDGVSVLNPQELSEAFRLRWGWVTNQEKTLLPDEKTVWTASGTELTPDVPLTLTCTVGNAVYTVVLTLDDKTGLRIEQTVLNNGSETLTLAPSQELYRNVPHMHGSAYQGPLGVFNGTLHEFSYDKIQKQGCVVPPADINWIGVGDSYWLTAFLYSGQAHPKTSQIFTGIPEHGVRTCRLTVADVPVTLQTGESHSYISHCFVGPKDLRVLEGYGKELDVRRMDLAIDFGWFYLLTKPLLWTISWLKEMTGSFAVALLALTVLLKIAFVPLTNKSYRSMAKAKEAEPDIAYIRERYKDDATLMNQKIVELYKTRGINPVAGCWPMLVQIPVFFGLYKVLCIAIEMRHAPFWGWINDLSVSDPTSFWNGFGAFPWAPLPFFSMGLWPVLMGVTMVLQSWNSPAQQTDPVQRRIMTYGMPVLFSYMMASLPAGLLIYWTWSNLLSFFQQWAVQRTKG